MIPPTITCARALRDAGIDAMATLDFAVAAALAGLTAKQASEVKLAFGTVMGQVVEQLINPAVKAFPELAPDEATWAAIARERANLRNAGYDQ